jgi:cobalt-zinc-cadmium efflux system outer membrane protein
MKFKFLMQCCGVCLALIPLVGLKAQTSALPVQTDTSVKVFTISGLVNAVLASNPALQLAQRSRDQAAAGVISAGALPNPRLELNGGENTARLPAASPGRVNGWAVSQLIENPAIREARVGIARSLERNSEFQIAFTRNELVAQIQLRAYEFLLRQDEASAASDAVNLLEQVRERVRLRVEIGEAPRYEIIKADAEIINARQRQQNAVLQAEQAMLALNRLAAGQLPARWSLQERLGGDASQYGLEELQRLTLSDNPELKVLRGSIDRAQAQLQSARSSRWPGVELRYSELTQPEVKQGILGVNVQIPLLDQRSGPIAEAQVEIERVRLRLDGRQAELRQQVLLAWKSLEMARLRVEALGQGALREAEAALRVSQAAYRFGERGILDVLDAQRVLRSVRADLLDARYQVQVARIELEFLSGRYADDKL